MLHSLFVKIFVNSFPGNANVYSYLATFRFAGSVVFLLLCYIVCAVARCLVYFQCQARFSYSLCVFMIFPVKFVFESWVANEAPYYFIMQPWFDLFFFYYVFSDWLAVVVTSSVVYVFYMYLLLLLYVTVFVGAILYSCLWFFIVYGCSVLFGCLVIFFFFVFVSFSLYLIDKVFKTPIAGLVLLSREFMALEDEDLWVSSNIFYLDKQIQNSKDFQVPLKSKEIGVFTTLLKLFFEEPLRDLQYGVFSSELTDFRDRQRIKVLEKKRFRELTQDLVPKRKFRRLKKSKRAAFELRYNQHLLAKSAFTVSPQRLEKSFYKFLVRNLRFYTKVQTKKKRKKWWVLLKSRFQSQNVLKLRFKERAAFSKRMTSIPGLFPSIDKKVVSQVNIPIAQLQSRSLRNNFVKPHLIPRINLKDLVFGFGDGSNYVYSQLQKIPRFRRFFWFSLPFYLAATSRRSVFFYALFHWRRFLRVLLDWVRAKFLGAIFMIFEDSWTMGAFYTRNYSPQQVDFIQFLRVNDLSFFPFPDNPEDLDDSAVSMAQRQKLVLQNRDSKVKINPREFIKRKPKKKGSAKFNEQMRIKQKKKLKVYRRRLRRKQGTLRKNVLISRGRYNFSTNTNVSGIRYPKLRFLHLYKLLEYFYFVLSHDFDFFEEAAFSAQVAALRDKYGQSIVEDLLKKSDHKQASKVSVIMHVTESPEVSGSTENVRVVPGNETVATTATGPSVIAEAPELTCRKQVFGTSPLRASPRVSQFSSDLLLSYRFKFRF